MASFLDYAARNPDAAQRKLEAMGRRLSALRAKGICTHGWLQTFPNCNQPHAEPHTVCLHCGVRWNTIEEAHNAGKAALYGN